MTLAEIKRSFEDLIVQGKCACEVAKIAARGRQSLRGDGTYGRKFHDAVVKITAAVVSIDRNFQNSTNNKAVEGWNAAKNTCETLKSHDADASTRMAAIKKLELTCQTVVVPALENPPPVDAPTVVERAEISKTPYLSHDEIEASRHMAELYVILHCYENSARKLIDEVLTKKLGNQWWDIAASMSMKNTVAQRQAKESKNKWITPRGTSAMYYVDWADLLYLIRKYEEDFKAMLPDYKFVEHRFEELERFRNIVAHNGTLPSNDEADHIIVSFKQWVKQLT